MRMLALTLLVSTLSAAKISAESFGPLTSSAKPCEREYIWPEGKMPDVQPHQIAAKTGEKDAPGFIPADFLRPYIDWYAPNPECRTDLCVITVSGGGFEICCDAERLRPAIDRFVKAGITVADVTYRTPRPRGMPIYQSAWEDLQRAVRIVRSKAAAKGLDPERIGIMGGSAGGHLALMGATSSRRRTYLPIDDIDKLSCKVQWAVAIYPAYALTDGIDGLNTNGGNTDDDRLVSDFSFDLDTCPVLFIHGDSDGYSAMASVKAWEQLRRMGVQGEVHTLATRPHCFQASAAPGTGSYTFLDRIWEFMNHKKAAR